VTKTPLSPLGWFDQSDFVLGLGSDTPLGSASNRTVWRNDRRMAAYHNGSGGAGAADAGELSYQALRAFLVRARADPLILLDDT
jgi:hypothetical protein